MEPSEATKETVIGDAEDLHRVGQFLAAVCAQATVSLMGKVRQVRHENLTHLTGGTRHQGDLRAGVDVVGHARAVVYALVVGVGVDQEESVGHGFTLDRSA